MSVSDLSQQVSSQVLSLEQKVVAVLHRASIPALRIVLGIVFVWFGALKLTGSSPVEALVTGTIPFGSPEVVMGVLGSVEILLGIAVAVGLLTRFVFPILAAHLTGTFLTFVMLPSLMFRNNDPFLLTSSGEFVLKNLILVAAVLVLIAHNPRSFE